MLHPRLLLLLATFAAAAEPPARATDLAALGGLKPGELGEVQLPQAKLTMFVRLPAGLVASEPAKPGSKAAPATLYPVIIFLHGMAGSAATVRTFADLIATAVAAGGDGAIVAVPVSPTLGWRDEEKEGALVRTGLNALLKAQPADPAQMVVWGFSQGGIFGSRLVFAPVPKTDKNQLPQQRRWPTAFAGYGCLLSQPATMPSNAKVWAGFPVLMTLGASDGNFPPKIMEPVRQDLKRMGLAVEGETIAGGHKMTRAIFDTAVAWTMRICQPLAPPPAKGR